MAPMNGESGFAQDPTKVGDSAAEPAADRKGKGKAVATDEEMKDSAMDEDDEDDEEEGAENDDDDDDDDGEDDLQEIDLDNVVGRRTRGRVIDFAKAAEENPADDEDEDDDDDFEDPDDKAGDKMDED